MSNNELQYYVVDSETTGLSSGYHEVTEIGIIRCKDKVQICRNVKCKYPERASMDALKITNKTLNDLTKGFDTKDVIHECNKFFAEDLATPEHRVIIAHNITFDRKFLHAMWEKEGEVFPANLWLCTMALSKDYAKNLGIIKPKVNLQAACDLVGIKKIASAHNAKSDSRNCFLLHKNLIEEKKMNYLPFIKNTPHFLRKEEFNLEDFDVEDFES